MVICFGYGDQPIINLSLLASIYEGLCAEMNKISCCHILFC